MPSNIRFRSGFIIGLIAGGHKAILKQLENAEDNVELGATDLQQIGFNHKDVLIGIAASGRTLFT